ncbi:MAG: DUF2147 domain-containing protein [Boseongicola sp.]
MKLRAILAALAVVVAGPAFAADPILGTFKTQPGDDGNFGHVQIYECDGAICGVIRRAFDASGAEIESENIGKRIIWDMQAKGGGKYSDGKIWAPDRDKVYKSKMELSGTTLNVSGCILIVCRAQTWTRVQ